MAGKLHTSYEKYAGSDNSSLARNPGWKLARAYAEGYQVGRDNMGEIMPNPVPVADLGRYAAWASGNADARAELPPTHVGGPLPVAPEPPPEPEGDDDESD